MRVLVLGGEGMLGHQVAGYLKASHQVLATVRRPVADNDPFVRLDVRDAEALRALIGSFRPQAVINAVGIVKQRAEAQDAVESIEINALFPHRLSLLCRKADAQLIHLSTDCVFSGRKGDYSEADPPDAGDLYGRSKLLGEVTEGRCLTLRTSIIGYEIGRCTGLLEWFLAQEGKRIEGYQKAIFSGFTTIELSRVIAMLISRYPDAGGLYHVSSEPISKFDLLFRIGEHLGLNITISPNTSYICDRSLDSTRFRRTFDYQPPSWEHMIAELKPKGLRKGPLS